MSPGHFRRPWGSVFRGRIWMRRNGGCTRDERTEASEARPRSRDRAGCGQPHRRPGVGIGRAPAGPEGRCGHRCGHQLQRRSPGRLPAQRGGHRHPGDDITFALSPSCSIITLTCQLHISGLTITGPGAGSLAISGGGNTGVFSTSSADHDHLGSHHRGRRRHHLRRRGHLEQRWNIERHRLHLFGQHLPRSTAAPS